MNIISSNNSRKSRIDRRRGASKRNNKARPTTNAKGKSPKVIFEFFDFFQKKTQTKFSNLNVF